VIRKRRTITALTRITHHQSGPMKYSHQAVAITP